MILPDSQCDLHRETLVINHTVDRGRQVSRTYCKSCRRERLRKRNGGLSRHSPLTDRCRKGHPKDRFNFRIYGGKLRCVPCLQERMRKKPDVAL